MAKIKSTYAILYGFKLDDIEDTAYFTVVNNRCTVTSEESLAKRFPLKKRRGQKSFGTPQQWCDLINEDCDLNKGYKFHVVKKL